MTGAHQAHKILKIDLIYLNHHSVKIICDITSKHASSAGSAIQQFLHAALTFDDSNHMLLSVHRALGWLVRDVGVQWLPEP